MSQGKKKSLADYGHDDSEWGYKDNSEKIEWEEHYQARRREGRGDPDNDKGKQDGS